MSGDEDLSLVLTAFIAYLLRDKLHFKPIITVIGKSSFRPKSAHVKCPNPQKDECGVIDQPRL